MFEPLDENGKPKNKRLVQQESLYNDLKEAIACGRIIKPEEPLGDLLRRELDRPGTFAKHLLQ